jgi:dienelactone hydrolase
MDRAAGIDDASAVHLDGLGLAEALLLRSGARADRMVLRLMETLFLVSNRRPAKHAEHQRDAFARYSDPALVATPERFFRAPDGPPAPATVREQVVRPLPDAGAIVRYRWPSAYRTFDPDYQARHEDYAENRHAYVHAWVHAGAGAGADDARPAVLAVHGWAQGSAWLDEKALGAESLYALGLDVHLLVLPFHGPRTPRGARLSGALFPSTNVRRTAEGFGQAIWDLRTWTQWLRRAAPARPVGVLGMSLGGYTAALWASLDSSLSFAIPLIPMVSMADLMWEHGKGNAERARAEARGITLDTMRRAFALHCPLSHAPRLPRERLLLLAGLGDRICHPSQARALWEHWQRPHIHWFPGGHLLWFGRREMRGEVTRFLRGPSLGLGLAHPPEGAPGPH